MTHVADSGPDRVLLPAPGTLDRAKAMEWMAFLASAVHPAFRTMFRAERVAGDSEQAIKNVREHGITALAEALQERSEERRVGKECASVDLGGRRIIKKKKQHLTQVTRNQYINNTLHAL